jgi:hypothetical protein
MRRAFLNVARKKKAIAARNALARSQALAPFRAEIEKVMKQWLGQLQGSGWAFAMGRGMRAAALKSYMEDFVLNNGKNLKTLQEQFEDLNYFRQILQKD